MTTAERMKASRKEIGVSAEEIAKEIKVSPATIYRYEKGDIEKMPLEILEPLSKVLRTTPAFLMGWEEETRESQIGGRLKELRETTGLSARKFAEELGIPYTTYYGYETGAREPGSDFLIKVAERFGVSVDYIIAVSYTHLDVYKRQPYNFRRVHLSFSPAFL